MHNNKKDNLIEKIVKKDYNNELELVLENKDFDESVKNLLLGIFYKIEIGYKDYKKVKRDVESKEQYIQSIINIVKNDCDSIKIVKPNSDESKIIENRTFVVNKEKKEIICYPIERKLLYALSKIGKTEKIIKDKYFLINETLSNTLNIGNNINTVEPLRDFNGWSWSTIPGEIENILYNVIYQNIRILIGTEFLNNWINKNEFLIDYLEIFQTNLEELYGKESSKKFIDELKNISVLMDLKFNEEIRNKMIKLDKKVKEELNKIDDKQKFIVDIANDKKQLQNKIKNIDEIINDKELLEQEYMKRNQGLPLEQKIFSMRVLKQMMFDERDQLLKEIEELNDLLNPQKYMRKKLKLQDEQKYLKLIEIQDIETQIEKTIIKMQKEFLKCFNQKIERVETKQEIINLVYDLRYYLMLPISSNQNIYNKKELQKAIEETQKLLIQKAIEYKIINMFSTDIKINHLIIKNIFSIRVISLEELNFKLIKEKDKIYICFFEEDIFEEKIEICKKEDLNKKELNIKFNKNIKLFV